MDNILSYVIVPYLGLKKSVRLIEIYGDLIWRGLRGKRYNIDGMKIREPLLWGMLRNDVIDIYDAIHVCMSSGFDYTFRELVKLKQFDGKVVLNSIDHEEWFFEAVSKGHKGILNQLKYPVWKNVEVEW